IPTTRTTGGLHYLSRSAALHGFLYGAALCRLFRWIFVRLFGAVFFRLVSDLDRNCHIRLSYIKSECIDDASTRGAAWQRCTQRPGQSAEQAHLCSAISVCGPRCSILDTI